MKTNKDILKWIHDNLGETIRELVNGEFKDTVYTEALIAGLICRETGFLILRYANQGMDLIAIASRMKGDYGRRAGESAPQYHGYGFVQIDTGSYPQFIRDTPLSDYKAWLHKAIEVLEEKRRSMVTTFAKCNIGPDDDNYIRAILAAYNSGQGNVIKSLIHGRDVDSTTYQGDYSKETMKFRYQYWDMFHEEDPPQPEGIVNDKPESEPIENKALAENGEGDTNPENDGTGKPGTDSQV